MTEKDKVKVVKRLLKLNNIRYPLTDIEFYFSGAASIVISVNGFAKYKDWAGDNGIIGPRASSWAWSGATIAIPFEEDND